MSDELARLREERHDGSVVVELSGEIDLSNAAELQARLLRAVEGAARVVIDLSALEYMDSQGLRLLQRLSRELDARGARFELVAPPDTVARDVLDIAGMAAAIEIRDAVGH